MFGGSIPRPQIFPGVFLKAINFAMQLKPTLLRGGGTITAADITEVKGGLLAVFATPERPYTLSKADASAASSRSASSSGGVCRARRSPPAERSASRSRRSGAWTSGTATVLYSYPDYIALGGKVLIPAPGVVITAGVDGSSGSAPALQLPRLGRGLHRRRHQQPRLHRRRGVGDEQGDRRLRRHRRRDPPRRRIPAGATRSPRSGSAFRATAASRAATGSTRRSSRRARAQAGGARTFKVAAGVKAVRVRIIGSGGAPDVR